MPLRPTQPQHIYFIERLARLSRAAVGGHIDSAAVWKRLKSTGYSDLRKNSFRFLSRAV